MAGWIKKNPGKMTLLGIVGLLFILPPLLLKPIVKQLLLDYTQPYGVQGVILDDLNINLFNGELSLNKLELHNTPVKSSDPDKAIASIGELRFDLKMTELFNQKVSIESIFLGNTHLPFTLNKQNQLSLSGIPLSTDDSQSEPKEKSSSIDFGIDQLEIEQVKLSLNYQQTPSVFEINSLKISHLHSWADDYARLLLDARLDESPISSNLQLHLFKKLPKIVGTFRAKELDLTQYQHFIQNQDIELGGVLNSDITFTFQVGATGIELHQQGRLDLKHPRFKQPNLNANLAHLNWQGDLHFKQSSESRLKLEGELAMKSASIEQNNQTASFSRSSLKGSTQIDFVENTQITLNQALKVSQLGLTNPEAKQRLQSDINLLTDSQIKLENNKLNINHNGKLALSNLSAKQPAQAIKLAGLNWQGDLKLQQTQVPQQANNPNKNPRLNIQAGGKIDLSKLSASQSSADNKQKMSLGKANWKGDLQLNQQAQLNLSTHGQLELTNLSAAQNDQNLAIGQTQWSGKLELDKHKQLKLSTDSQLKLTELSATQKALTTKLKQGILKGNFNLKQTDQLTLSGQGRIDAQQAEVFNQNRVIASLGALAVKQFNLASLTSLEAKGIQTKSLEVGKTGEQPGLTHLKQLDITKLNFAQSTGNQSSKLTIGDITLSGSETHLTVNADKKVNEVENLLAALPGEKPTQDQTTATEKEAPKTVKVEPSTPPSFVYSLNGFNIQGDNPVHIQVQTVEPVFKKTLKLEEFTLGKLSNLTPNEKSQYRFKLILDEFGKLQSQGSISPLNPKHHLVADTKLIDMSLLELTKLSENSVGYQIESGQVSAEFKTKLKDNQIDSDNQLHLHQFELQSLNTEKTQKLQANFPVPLETGLAMLKDKNDNIDLSLPIKGDISSPDFDASDVITKALGTALAGATKSYLLLALQPFGAIAMVGEMALDSANAISLQPVVFKLGSTEIDPEMQTYLKKIHSLLKERKAIQIKLCQGVSEADRQFMLEKIAIANAKKQAETGQITKETERKVSDQQLSELATERQKAIKRLLLKLGTRGKQVILCKPEISKDTDKSLVNLNI